MTVTRETFAPAIVARAAGSGRPRAVGKPMPGPGGFPWTPGRRSTRHPVERHRDKVAQLAAAVQEPLRGPARRAVLEIERHLGDAEAGAVSVGRHPDLHAEARREGRHGGEDLAA